MKFVIKSGDSYIALKEKCRNFTYYLSEAYVLDFDTYEETYDYAKEFLKGIKTMWKIVELENEKNVYEEKYFVKYNDKLYRKSLYSLESFLRKMEYSYKETIFVFVYENKEIIINTKDQDFSINFSIEEMLKGCFYVLDEVQDIQ